MKRKNKNKIEIRGMGTIYRKRMISLKGEGRGARDKEIKSKEREKR